jgi:hypothetical protein
MDDSEGDVLAYMAFPAQHRTKLHSANPLERLNKEVKRRADVVGIFPSEASIISLVPSCPRPMTSGRCSTATWASRPWARCLTQRPSTKPCSFHLKPPYLYRQKHSHELADRKESEAKQQRDLVRLYSDPLKDAVTSLRHRLNEIVDQKQARYLLAGAPNTSFHEYKRTSTLYRIAAVLGWIRAIRRERSFLDPQQLSASHEMQAIDAFEKALADGQHVELQRLDELAILWRVSTIAPPRKGPIASLIDGERADFLAMKGAPTASSLSEQDRLELAERCAAIIRQEAGVDIPCDIVAANTKQSTVIFGIKESYIYRDWQAAIGNLMLQEDKRGARHFSVIGFGAFEDMVFQARKDNPSDVARWISRLQRLIFDRDMTRVGMFDARIEQLRRIYDSVGKLESGLEQRIRGTTASQGSLLRSHPSNNTNSHGS